MRLRADVTHGAQLPAEHAAIKLRCPLGGLSTSARDKHREIGFVGGSPCLFRRHEISEAKVGDADPLDPPNEPPGPGPSERDRPCHGQNVYTRIISDNSDRTPTDFNRVELRRHAVRKLGQRGEEPARIAVIRGHQQVDISRGPH